MNDSEYKELREAFNAYCREGYLSKAYLCAESVYTNDREYGKPMVYELRDAINYAIEEGADLTKAYDALRQTYFLEAKDNLDAFMIAMEWERNPKDRFWLPRRKILEEKFGVCTAIDRFIEEPGGKKLTLSTPPGCGKSTLIKFVIAYLMGKFPQSKNMYVTYGDGMVKLMMDAVLSMTCDDEYRFNEIFGIGKPDKSSEYNTVGYRRRGDAQTFSFCSVGGAITGRTRANLFQITDDLVKNAEEARSPERLETLYNNYTDTITTRQIGDDVKEIMLGTIWSIYDPISREKATHEGKKGYHFIALPVCDDEGHSNFNYDCQDRYTDEKIASLKEKLDPVTFSCLYLQRGVQKEGMPFTHEQLQWYDGVLPTEEPDNVYAYCDVAWGGGDSLSMPIAYQYGDDIYVHDMVFSRCDKSKTIPMVVSAIMNNGVRMVRFEANVGGTEYADEVSKILKEKGYSCNVTSKRAPNNMTKLSKIEQHQNAIRTQVYFRRDNERCQQYPLFVNELETFSFTQKNLHDDAADSLAGLIDFQHGGHSKVVLGKRLF